MDGLNNNENSENNRLKEFYLFRIADLLIYDIDLFQVLEQCCRGKTDKIDNSLKEALTNKGLMNENGGIPRIVKDIILDLPE